MSNRNPKGALARLRIDRRMSRRELEDLSGISTAMLQQYEVGQLAMSTARARKLAATLGVPLETVREAHRADRRRHLARLLSQLEETRP